MKIMRKDELYRKYQAIWRESGLSFTQWRTDEGLTKTFVADKIGISRSTLTKFEAGYYIRNRKLIEKSYSMLKENHNLLRVIRKHEFNQIECIQITLQYNNGKKAMTLQGSSLKPAI
jgi:DNA-binding XRE family transcriptional regulator